MNYFTDLFTSINPLDIFSILCAIAFCISGYLVFIIVERNKKIKEQDLSLSKLMRSFNNLDEQAKLIVKTDLELNKAQEELDKRLAGLNALQKISRLISTTFDASEIYQRLKNSLPTDLGFERILLMIAEENHGLQCRLHVGFKEQENEIIALGLTKDQGLMTDLKEGKTSSSLTSPKQRRERIENIFGTVNFILNPILTQDGFIGLLFVGNQDDEDIITEGAEELISILSNQIGQSLENTQLFEQVYRSRHGLELKIQERTKQLASALEEVKKISKNKSDFVSAVSHELRTPLTSIKGYASILMEGKVGEIPVEVKERLEKVNKHSDNLVKLINDLLDISRIESGRVEMKKSPHKIPDMVDNVSDLLTPQMREKDINFQAEIAEDIPQILVDGSQVDRVFINLLSNAIKFTPQKGTITIKANPEGDFIHFEVSDTGIGIKEDDLSRLFEEFYRVDNEFNQNIKGTGLGLALVKNIIEAHSGRIWVTSQVNVGTTFHFTFPIVQ